MKREYDFSKAKRGPVIPLPTEKRGLPSGWTMPYGNILRTPTNLLRKRFGVSFGRKSGEPVESGAIGQS